MEDTMNMFNRISRIVMNSSLLLTLIVAFVSLGADNEDKAYADKRKTMVQKQIKQRGIKDSEVLKAMRSVPRHLFVQKAWTNHAYEDRPLPIGHGQTISQPYIVAYMTEELDLENNDKVLEVGTGSGYQAAVLAEIVDKVYTLEIIPELAKSGKAHLRKAGYKNVIAKAGNGYFGWEEHAPFDAIVVTAAATHIPPPLVEQLKRGGRMIIPVGPPTRVQKLMVVVKKETGDIVKYPKMPVRFVPLTGEKAKKR
jgi:protein-L-isoaspartate(D-aspartate) O-methyltransferase